jgi:hypothetical protein
MDPPNGMSKKLSKYTVTVDGDIKKKKKKKKKRRIVSFQVTSKEVYDGKYYLNY